MMNVEEKVTRNEKEFKKLCRDIYKHYYSSEENFPKVNIKSNLVRNGGTRPCIIEYNSDNNKVNVTLNSICFYPYISKAKINLAAFETVVCIHCIAIGKKFNCENSKYYRTKDFRKVAVDLGLVLDGNIQCLRIASIPIPLKDCPIASDYNFIKYENSEIKTNFQNKSFKQPKKESSFKLVKTNTNISPIADRFNFKCPKCNQVAFSENKIELVCGKCFVRMNMEDM